MDVHKAAEKGDFESLQQILNADRGKVAQTDRQGNTALFPAAKGGHTKCVKLLLDAGVDLEAKGKYQRRALHRAAFSGNPEVVAQLVGAGAEVNAAGERGWTPLHEAAFRGHPECVTELVTAGAEVDVAIDSGLTPLHKAASSGHPKCVAELIAAGAKVNVENEYGSTPLHLAANEGCTECLEPLVRAGADPNLENKSGKTPLALATKRNHLDTVEKLLSLKDAQEKDRNYSTYDIAGKESTPSQIKDLAVMNCMRVMTAGDQGMGKTTIVKTILHGKSSIAEEDDRTVVANFALWVPEGDKTKVISMVDLGGHESYQSTGQFFYRNAANNVIAVCHDITSDKYDKTFEWLETILYSSPESHTTLLLTKADKIKAHEQNRKKEVFLKKLDKFLERKLKELKLAICFAENHKLDAKYQEAVQSLNRKYEQLRKNSQEFTFVVSCVEGHEETIKPVKDHFLKLSEHDQNKVYLTEAQRLLYQKLGKLGINVPQIRRRDEKKKASPESRGAGASTAHTGKLANWAKKKQKKILQVWKSIKLWRNKNTHRVKENVPATDETWRTMRTQYVVLEEVISKYEHILKELNLPTTEVKKQTMDALDILNKNGLLIYFRESENLQNIIFNDFATFTNILRCIFHHRTGEFLTYEEDDESILKYYTGLNAEEIFHEDLKSLNQKGMMTQDIIGVLLHKNNCDLDIAVVVELLDKMDVGYSFTNEQESSGKEKLIFIPYFISNLPDFDNSQIYRSEQHKLSVTLQVSSNLNISYWHFLLVRLYAKLYSERKFQKQTFWKNGFYATHGKSDAELALTMTDAGEIKFTVKANITEAEGHNLIWKYISDFSKEIDNLMTRWWRSMPRKNIVRCSHCTIQRQMQDIDEGNSTVQEWCTEDLINAPEQEMVDCKATEEKIPAALIMPLATDQYLAQKQLADLQKYLQKTCANPQQTAEEDVAYQEEARSGTSTGMTRAFFNCSLSESDGNLKLQNQQPQGQFEKSYTQAPVSQQNMEQIQEHLDHLVKVKHAGNEEIYEWVKSHLRKCDMKTSSFIRALVTSICSDALTEHTGGCRVNPCIVRQRRYLLQLYLCNHNPHLELQALYAVQALMHKLNHPRDMLRQLFDVLYDEHIISDDAFHQWNESTDPAEQAGRETACNSVRRFFRRLLRAEVVNQKNIIFHERSEEDSSKIIPVDDESLPKATEQKDDLRQLFLNPGPINDGTVRSKTSLMKPRATVAYSNTSKATPYKNQPKTSHPLEPPEIPWSDFKLDRNDILGRGNYGTVFRSTLYGTPVAIKEVTIHHKRKEEVNASMSNELTVCRAIRHPSTIQLMKYAFHLDSATKCQLYLVYELVDGHNLEEVIFDDELIEAYTFNTRAKYCVLRKVSQALAYLHNFEPEIIIHRDIKPANIMITRHGDAKLCDFGLSKMKENNLLMTTAGEGRGTPLYMAPELFLQKTSTTMSDMYAFGVTVYEVIFEDQLWDIDDSTDGLNELKSYLKMKKYPPKLKEAEHHPVHKLIMQCINYEWDKRSSAKSVEEELSKLYNEYEQQ